MKLKKLSYSISLALPLLAAPVFAQSGDAAKVLEKVELTGSNIKRGEGETASPVLILSAEEIRRTGVTTVAELMQMLTVTGAGGLDTLSAGSGFSRGAATVSLRGLGSAATLVLLNGRRMAPAAYADPNTGESTVYNLNSLPISALERVEVLKDGASALYGSDAIAGVVNFILRSNYRGAEVTASGFGSLQGGGRTERIAALAGFGGAAHGFSALFAIEHRRREATPIDTLDAVKQEQLGRLDQRLDQRHGVRGDKVLLVRRDMQAQAVANVLRGDWFKMNVHVGCRLHGASYRFASLQVAG